MPLTNTTARWVAASKRRDRSLSFHSPGAMNSVSYQKSPVYSRLALSVNKSLKLEGTGIATGAGKPFAGHESCSPHELGIELESPHAIQTLHTPRRSYLRVQQCTVHRHCCLLNESKNQSQSESYDNRINSATGDCSCSSPLTAESSIMMNHKLAFTCLKRYDVLHQEWVAGLWARRRERDEGSGLRSSHPAISRFPHRNIGPCCAG